MSAQWLAIQRDGSGAWSPVGWFYDTNGPFGLERAYDLAIKEVRRLLVWGGVSPGWFYIYTPGDNNNPGAVVGRAEAPSVFNGSWVSKSSGIGVVGPDGQLHPDPPDVWV